MHVFALIMAVCLFDHNNLGVSQTQNDYSPTYVG